MGLIDVNQYFVESRKAIQVVVEKEQSLYGNSPMEEKLSLLKKRKKETTSEKEYEKIEELEKQLEREIKFKRPIPLVPEEYKEMIKKNVEIENNEVNKKLKDLRSELKKHLPLLQGELLPLLINIHELEKIKGVPNQIDIALESFFEEHAFLKTEYRINQMKRNQKSILVEKFKEIISGIESAAVKKEVK